MQMFDVKLNISEVEWGQTIQQKIQQYHIVHEVKIVK